MVRDCDTEAAGGPDRSAWLRRGLPLAALTVSALFTACEAGSTVAGPDPLVDSDPALSVLAADPWLMGLTEAISDPHLRAVLAPPDDSDAVRDLVSRSRAGTSGSWAGPIEPDDAIVLDVFLLSLAAADDALAGPSGDAP